MARLDPRLRGDATQPAFALSRFGKASRRAHVRRSFQRRRIGAANELVIAWVARFCGP